MKATQLLTKTKPRNHAPLIGLGKNNTANSKVQSHLVNGKNIAAGIYSPNFNLSASNQDGISNLRTGRNFNLSLSSANIFAELAQMFAKMEQSLLYNQSKSADITAQLSIANQSSLGVTQNMQNSLLDMMASSVKSANANAQSNLNTYLTQVNNNMGEQIGSNLINLVGQVVGDGISLKSSLNIGEVHGINEQFGKIKSQLEDGYAYLNEVSCEIGKLKNHINYKIEDVFKKSDVLNDGANYSNEFKVEYKKLIDDRIDNPDDNKINNYEQHQQLTKQINDLLEKEKNGKLNNIHFNADPKLNDTISNGCDISKINSFAKHIEKTTKELESDLTTLKDFYRKFTVDTQKGYINSKSVENLAAIEAYNDKYSTSLKTYDEALINNHNNAEINLANGNTIEKFTSEFSTQEHSKYTVLNGEAKTQYETLSSKTVSNSVFDTRLTSEKINAMDTRDRTIQAISRIINTVTTTATQSFQTGIQASSSRNEASLQNENSINQNNLSLYQTVINTNLQNLQQFLNSQQNNQEARQEYTGQQGNTAQIISQAISGYWQTLLGIVSAR